MCIRDSADAVKEVVIAADQAEDLVIVCGVFIHPAAEDDAKIFQYNYEATLQSIRNAMTGDPSVQKMLDGRDGAAHPFKGC